MMSPMSPEPMITARRPGMQPSMFTRRWASPAVNTPAGGCRRWPRCPGCAPGSPWPAPRPVWRSARRRALRERAVSTLPPAAAPPRSPSPWRPGDVDARRASTGPMKRSAYSGPVRSSPNSCRPNPLWMHCRRMPPRNGSRSTMATVSARLAQAQRGRHARASAADHHRVHACGPS